MFFRCVVLCVAFLTFWAPAAQAAEINREGADHLKSIFEQFLAEYQTMSSGDARSVYEGEVVVEPSQTYYAITLPYYKLVDIDGSRIDVGMISINAAPDTTNPKRWKMAIAMPTPIVRYDATNKPLFRIDIGSQRAAGVFDEDLKYFLKMNALYTDITAQTTDAKKFALRIPEAAIEYDFTQSGQDGLLSGSGFMVVKNAAFQADAGQATGKFNEARADFSLDKYNLAQFNQSRQRLLALTQGLSTQGVDMKARNKTINDLQAALYSSFGEGIKFDYQIKEAEFNGPAKDATSAAHTLKIGNFLFGMTLGGFMSGNGKVETHMGFDSLSMTGDPQESEILPSQARIAISLHKIPVKDLTQIGQTALMGSMQNPDMAGMAMLNTMMKVPAILSQAGSYALIENNYIAGKDYRFDLNGNLKADIKAFNNFTADVKGRFAGLDGLTEKVQRLAITGGEKADHYTDILKHLQMLQSMGRKEPDSSVYTYNFTVTPEGAMLMNGQDTKQASPPRP